MRKTTTKFTCPVCHIKMYVPKCRARKMRTCGNLDCRKVVNRIKKNCPTCGKEMILPKGFLNKKKYCSVKCVPRENGKFLVKWIHEHPEEMRKRGIIGGKLGYSAIQKWKKENPEKAREQSSRNAKKCIQIRKERGTYHDEMVRAGHAGSIENKIKAAKKNAEINLDMLRENAKKYGVRGGKMYSFNGNKFRSKLEIEVYKMFIEAGINVLPNVQVGQKEIDFIIPSKHLALEIHPINVAFDTRKIEKYYEDRKKVLETSIYKDFDLIVFTRKNHIKNWITSGGDIYGKEGSKHTIYSE